MVRAGGDSSHRFPNQINGLVGMHDREVGGPRARPAGGIIPKNAGGQKESPCSRYEICRLAFSSRLVSPFASSDDLWGGWFRKVSSSFSTQRYIFNTVAEDYLATRIFLTTVTSAGCSGRGTCPEDDDMHSTIWNLWMDISYMSPTAYRRWPWTMVGVATPRMCARGVMVSTPLALIRRLL